MLLLEKTTAKEFSSRPWYGSGLVGFRDSGLRISCWPTTVLEPKSSENLRTVWVSSLTEMSSTTNAKGRIVEGKVRYPHFMSPDARDLIGGLCTVNPTHRLGNISGGSAAIKSHAFFKTIDWDALYKREMKGPIVPELKHAADASNFDDYDPAPESSSTYTKDLMHKYDHEFKDF